MIQPPPLKDDCFALPPGVDWIPVDEALEALRARLSVVAPAETLPTREAHDRFLAEDVFAVRAHPPAPNTAVDGYGFAHASTGEGVQVLPLVKGRAAAGVPFGASVPLGSAVRVLTGASLPDGVDTVVLDEDVTVQDGQVAFHGPVKPGANTRKAGEDLAAGDLAVAAGTRLGPAELALMAAVGVHGGQARQRLRVAILSTGDELTETEASPGQIYDANRPMLLALMQSWGFEAVDLGIVPDDPAALAQRLDQAAGSADVILTSGGASAGDEDHVSALLRRTGSLAHWRIALKPGRPLALGVWQGVPIFGLPGNPVAALVCTLVFGAPAMRLLAGGPWRAAQGFWVPAAFSKSKKPGRQEFLRARIDKDGRAEPFASEGSGRVSGLSWATGLVALGHEAQVVRPGDLVQFLPYESFRP